MASTYSTSLQIQLIASGEQSGVWGTTTNTNWNLIEQAVAGVQSITMINANYTLTVLNGVSDEARNMVLFVGGTNSAIRQIVAPLVPKVYVVYNNTSGGYAITIGGATGTLATVPASSSTLVFCDGSNFYAGISGAPGNFSIAGNATVAGTLSVTGAATFSSTIAGTLASTVTGTTQTAGDNSTKIATTAYVATAITNATGSLGTMSSQNANAVAITGGTITNAVVTTLGEVTTVSATAATGTINYDVITQGVLYYTTNASANWTTNFRGSSGTSLNTLMAVGETRTVTFLVTQGATAYYNSAVQVDGSSVTPKWQGGAAPTSGNPSSIDIYTYSIIKTASATFTVLASQTRFA
jgi:hypothetical protein